MTDDTKAARELLAPDDPRSSWIDAYLSSAALPCPFCGVAPIIVPWHGGGPRKRMVMCHRDECAVSPSVAASTEVKAIAARNRRITRAAPVADDALADLPTDQLVELAKTKPEAAVIAAYKRGWTDREADSLVRGARVLPAGVTITEAQRKGIKAAWRTMKLGIQQHQLSDSTIEMLGVALQPILGGRDD